MIISTLLSIIYVRIIISKSVILIIWVSIIIRIMIIMNIRRRKKVWRVSELWHRYNTFYLHSLSHSPLMKIKIAQLSFFSVHVLARVLHSTLKNNYFANYIINIFMWVYFNFLTKKNYIFWFKHEISDMLLIR